MKHNLNLEQLQAIEHVEGPLLVLAGAGSGKTRVVTTRIVHLLEQGVPPDRILGVTFTNKAAGEMRERVARLTHCHVLICTFHSLGARILRESIDALGYRRDFTIYDVEDSEKLIKHCLIDLNQDDKKKEVKTFRERISRAKNALQSPGDVALEDEFFSKVYQLYQAKLKDSQALDFDDLIYLPVVLFREHPEVLALYQNRWEYLLIDEYQDTNAVQYTMVKLLVNKHQNLCVVGDPDQSIYAWRGADIHNILHFEKDYPGAKVIKLEQNYRSVQTILAAAAAVISNNTERYEKSLWSERGEGEKIKVYSALNERDEASFTAARIKHHQSQGASLNDIVVFYRTHFQSRALEDEFLARRIPYVIVGGISFYQRREIKDILSYLKIVQSGADFVAFARTINLPKRGVGDATIDKLRLAAGQEGMGIYNYCLGVLQNHIDTPVRLTAKQKNGLQNFIDLIEKLRQKLRENASLKDIVMGLIEESGYLEVLKEEPDTLIERKENLDSLISKAMEWEAIHGKPDLTAFLEELTLKSSLDEAAGEDERVHLMTLHNSKGLEFPIAFIVGMEEDLFPHVNSRDSPEEVEEERRLCYVGITRARDLLYLSHCSERFMWGMTCPHRKSRFLYEIPTKYTERVRVQRF